MIRGMNLSTDADGPTRALTAGEVETFLAAHFPELARAGFVYAISGIELNAHGRGVGQMRLAYSDLFLRPGGTISGPTLFTLADVGAYATLLGQIGPVPLAVTTSIHVAFLSRAEPDDLIGAFEIKKLGRRLAIIDCDIYRASDGPGKLVAQATATYAIPPDAA